MEHLEDTAQLLGSSPGFRVIMKFLRKQGILINSSIDDFYPMSIHRVPSLVPSRVDKEGPRMVRVQVNHKRMYIAHLKLKTSKPITAPLLAELSPPDGGR